MLVGYVISFMSHAFAGPSSFMRADVADVAGHLAAGKRPTLAKTRFPRFTRTNGPASRPRFASTNGHNDVSHAPKYPPSPLRKHQVSQESDGQTRSSC